LTELEASAGTLKRAGELESELGTARLRIAELEAASSGSAAALAEEWDRARSATARLETEQAALRAEAEQALLAVEALRREKESETRRAAAAEKSVSELRARLGGLEEAATASSSSADEAARLTERLAMIEGALAETRSRAESAEAERDALREELSVKDRTFAGEKTAREDLVNRIADLTRRLEMLTGEETKARETASGLAVEAEEGRRIREELRLQNEDLRAESARLAAAVAEMEARSDAAATEAAAIRQEKDRLRMENEALRRAAEEEKAGLAERSAAATVRETSGVETLSMAARLAAAREGESLLAVRREEIESRLRLVEEERDALARERNAALEKAEFERQRADDYRRSAEASTASADGAGTPDEERRRLIRARDAAQARIEELRQENLTLRTQLEAVTDSEIRAIDAVSELERERDALERRLGASGVIDGDSESGARMKVLEAEISLRAADLERLRAEQEETLRLYRRESEARAKEIEEHRDLLKSLTNEETSRQAAIEALRAEIPALERRRGELTAELERAARLIEAARAEARLNETAPVPAVETSTIPVDEKPPRPEDAVLPPPPRMEAPALDALPLPPIVPSSSFTPPSFPDTSNFGFAQEIAAAPASSTSPVAATGSVAGEIEAMIRQAYVLEDGGRSSEAIRVYQDILALDPRHVRSGHNMALILFRAGDMDAAGQIFERLLDQHVALPVDSRRLFMEIRQRQGKTTGLERIKAKIFGS
jgi:chromosome segregation ATPase